MKRLVLPLLAALALPNAVNAESYWLVLFSVKTGIEKIEMASMEQCEEQGYDWEYSGFGSSRYYKCFIGK